MPSCTLPDGGQVALQQRIARAAKNVCGTPDLRDVTATRMVIECRQRAIAGSQPALHAALAAAQQRGSAALGAAVLTVTAR
ncbi:MAG: UrcA family protein [Sphingomonas sp.]